MDIEMNYVVLAKASYSLGYPDSDVCEYEEFSKVEVSNISRLRILSLKWLIEMGFVNSEVSYETETGIYIDSTLRGMSMSVTIEFYPCIKVMDTLYKLTPFEK